MNANKYFSFAALLAW